MKPHDFLDAIDDDKIIAAIHRAEERTGATIRVHISHQAVPDAAEAARRQFTRFKALPKNHKSGNGRNGRVLIFIAPKSRTFALHGDAIVHAACGPSGWNELVDLLSSYLKSNDITGGLISIIDAIATRLGSSSAAE